MVSIAPATARSPSVSTVSGPAPIRVSWAAGAEPGKQLAGNGKHGPTGVDRLRQCPTGLAGLEVVGSTPGTGLPQEGQNAASR